jgi:hypothetical protein
MTTRRFNVFDPVVISVGQVDAGGALNIIPGAFVVLGACPHRTDTSLTASPSGPSQRLALAASHAVQAAGPPASKSKSQKTYHQAASNPQAVTCEPSRRRCTMPHGRRPCPYPLSFCGAVTCHLGGAERQSAQFSQPAVSAYRSRSIRVGP